MSAPIGAWQAKKELEKIDHKLQGIMQLRGAAPLTVQGQVQQLINDATEISNLAQMYAALSPTPESAHAHVRTRPWPRCSFCTSSTLCALSRGGSLDGRYIWWMPWC